MTRPADSPPTTDPAGQVSALLLALHARAAGLWRVEGDRLVQLAFVPAADLPGEVTSEFARVTLSVSLSQTNLGIVQAAATATVAVSRASELPPDSGSGRWLRAFSAFRSVAVPLLTPSGQVAAVLSVALADATPPDNYIAAVVRGFGRPLNPAI